MPGKILIIDDDPLAVKLMKLSLAAEGFEVVAAQDAQEGLRAIQTERPGLILLDIMMPDIDGVEMCRLLRSQPDTADIPIIFLTAKTQLDDKIEGLRAGADDYITKPADPREVVARVEAVLARTRRVSSTKQGRIVALVGAKGGVGTSTVAVNLGSALAQRKVSTLLIDMHHHTGTVTWQLKLTPTYSLADLLAMEADQIDSRWVEKVLITHFSGLCLLPSPPTGARLTELPAAQARAIVRSARPLADVILLDLPHVPSPASKEALNLSDVVLVVLGPQPMDVTCAEQALALLKDTGLSSEMIGLVVVTRTQSAINLPLGDIERSLNKRCLGIIPLASEELALSYQRGEPIALSKVDSVAAISLRELAERVQAKISGRAIGPR